MNINTYDRLEIWLVDDLLDLYKHQINNHGDESYINKIKSIIKTKTEKDKNWREKIKGDGCCSEYRNSVLVKVKEIEELIRW